MMAKSFRSAITTYNLWPVETFFMLACLLALSLANGGLGFPCLAKSVFSYLSVTDLDQRSNLRWKTYLTLKSKKSLRK